MHNLTAQILTLSLPDRLRLAAQLIEQDAAWIVVEAILDHVQGDVLQRRLALEATARLTTLAN